MLLFEVAERFAAQVAVNDQGEPAIRPGQARRIAGLAFLVMVRAWEELVEACLVRYSAGASAPSGYTPVKLSLQRCSLKSAFTHASKNGLAGGPDHLSVTDWSKICTFAKTIFLTGAPFSSITDRQKTLLKNATKIRNRIAHSSPKARKEFIEVAKVHRELKPHEALKGGYTVGHLLLTEGNRCVGTGAKKRAYFRHYHQLFLSMADVICPKQTSGR